MPLSVGIIGSGFGAVAAAVPLLAAGHDVRLWERADGAGGVWRENTYPGAGCDIPSPLYSFSFRPHPGWTRRYAGHAEILDYLRTVADEHGVTARTTFGVAVRTARWDAAAGRWDVTFADGSTESVDVLVSAVGQLSTPRWPDLPGLEEFGGDLFHSAAWDHDVDLAGRRVAVVGTGASAVQLVPPVAEAAASTVVFQRSAPHVAPKPDRPYPGWRRWLHRRMPATLRLERRAIWLLTELMARGMVDRPLYGRVTAAICAGHLRRQARDPALRAVLTPDHPNGCKRVLFSNAYLPALCRDDVEVVTERVVALTTEGVRTDDGRTHPVDVVVLGTGFEASDLLASVDLVGVDGVSLATTWSDGAFAHHGITVPGFPNFAVLYGPNTNLGSGSITDVLEAQAAYVARLVAELDRRGGTVEVRADVAHAYDRAIQDRLRSTVWTRCASWYRSPTGRVTANWPGSAGQYARSVRSLDVDEHVWSAR